MLASLERELEGELPLLLDLQRRKTETLRAGSILVGAGDSYAAALCVSHLSPVDCTALDPYELMISPEAARSKAVVFLSVSGRTRSNVAAARRVMRTAAETVAITANGEGPLAEAVDRTVLIPYDYQPRTPGMASFVLTLAAAAKMLSVDLRTDLARAFSSGKRVSRGLRFSNHGTTFFLGNRALYAISIYAAAKLYEFFGAKAQYQRLEEFSHMELFSINKGDSVNIYEGFDPLKIGKTLAKSLASAHYDSYLAATGVPNGAESAFTAIFATQFAVLRWAKAMKLERPYISAARDKIAISDSMIY